jgi:fumarate reductase flavoprotein subunit
VHPGQPLRPARHQCLRQEEAIALIHDGEPLHGRGRPQPAHRRADGLRLRATAICTGGFGRLYTATTNAVICDGGGHAIAHATGVVPIGNPEAIQFHPTGIVPTDILVTEGCRGDGGTLLDVEPRAVHAHLRAGQGRAGLPRRGLPLDDRTTCAQGKGVKSAYGEHLWLDIRHLGDKHISTKLREVDEICQNFLGVDPREDLIPVRPTQHYTMAGIGRTRTARRTGWKGSSRPAKPPAGTCTASTAWAATPWPRPWSPAASSARRSPNTSRGPTSLSTSGVIREAVNEQQARIDNLISRKNGREEVFKVRAEMQEALMDGCFVFRNGADLERCVATLQEILSARSRSA